MADQVSGPNASGDATPAGERDVTYVDLREAGDNSAGALMQVFQIGGKKRNWGGEVNTSLTHLAHRIHTLDQLIGVSSVSAKGASVPSVASTFDTETSTGDAISTGFVDEDNTATGYQPQAGDSLLAQVQKLTQQAAYNNTKTQTILDDYVTSTSLSTTLGGYVTSTSLTTTLGGYVSSSDLTTALSSYATTSSLGSYVTNTSLSTTLGGYVSNTSLTTTLGDYVTSSSLATTLAGYPTSGSLGSTYLSKVANDTSTGIITAAGFDVSSDKKLKKNIKTLCNSVEMITNLRPVSYEYKASVEGERYGFIAQDLQKVMPSAVKENELGYLSIDNNQILAALVGAVKYLLDCEEHRATMDTVLG